MLELESRIESITVKKTAKTNGFSGYTSWIYTISTGNNVIELTEEEAETLYYTLGVMTKQGRARK